MLEMKGQRTQDACKVCVSNTALNIKVSGEEIKSTSKLDYLWQSNKVNWHGFAPLKSLRYHPRFLLLFLQELLTPHVTGLVTALFPGKQVYTSNQPLITQWVTGCNRHC